jgi:3-phosphoshikimate 1-carboxyvinyltransferase
VSGPATAPAGGLQAIDLDCNHIPDAAMTLAVMALYADRHHHAAQHRELARQGNGPARRHGLRTAQARRHRRGRVPTSCASRRRRAVPDWRAACIHTYDDHRMAMCLSLAAFNPAGLPVRIEDPKCVAKTFPDYFETLFSVVQTPLERIPVICVDGPTASGKGTLAAELAQAPRLPLPGFRRPVPHHRAGRHPRRAAAGCQWKRRRSQPLVSSLDIHFGPGQIFLLGDEDVSDIVRSEAMGMNASKVSVLPLVRHALIDLQHARRRLPGLVADGRDMGTVIFPQAPLKVFLTASAAKRAERRISS